MKKAINFLVKKSSFIFYKRTLALVLAFVMLFNLTSETFAMVAQAAPFANLFEKTRDRL